MSHTVLIKDTVSEKEEALDAISSVIQRYVQGGRKGKASLMRPAFHENATIHGYFGASLLAGPINILFDWVDTNPPASDLVTYIVNIDVADTVATARLELHN
jgi:Putative lumazine-binding